MSRGALLLFIVVAIAAAAAAAAFRTFGAGENEAGAATTTVATSTSPPSSIAEPDPPPASTAPATSAVPPPTLPPGTTVCDDYRALSETGAIENPAIVEASGVARNSFDETLLWIHNDSGDSATLYAVGRDGADHGSFRVDEVGAFDWEDIAVGPGPDGSSHIYVGDIGDNLGIRGGNVTVYRLPEPAELPPDGRLSGAVAIQLRYPDGSPNAETLLVDPRDGGIFLVTREVGKARVYAAEGNDGASTEMRLVAELDLPAQVTGGDISADGSTIALRGEHNVWLWHRAPGETVAAALAGVPCDAPSPEERQGEALALTLDRAYVTVSEGRSSPIHEVGLD